MEFTGMIKIFFIYKLLWSSFESIGHSVHEKSLKYIFKMEMAVAILDFQSEQV